MIAECRLHDAGLPYVAHTSSQMRSTTSGPDRLAALPRHHRDVELGVCALIALRTAPAWRADAPAKGRPPVPRACPALCPIRRATQGPASTPPWRERSERCPSRWALSSLLDSMGTWSHACSGPWSTPKFPWRRSAEVESSRTISRGRAASQGRTRRRPRLAADMQAARLASTTSGEPGGERVTDVGARRSVAEVLPPQRLEQGLDRPRLGDQRGLNIERGHRRRVRPAGQAWLPPSDSAHCQWAGSRACRARPPRAPGSARRPGRFAFSRGAGPLPGLRGARLQGLLDPVETAGRCYPRGRSWPRSPPRRSGMSRRRTRRSRPSAR